jgi:hypothetical protein
MHRHTLILAHANGLAHAHARARIRMLARTLTNSQARVRMRIEAYTVAHSVTHKRPCARTHTRTGSTLIPEQPHSRVHLTNTYLRGSRRDRRASACSLVAFSDRNGVTCFDCAGIALDDRQADVSIAMRTLLGASRRVSDKPRSSILGNGQPELGTQTPERSAKPSAKADYWDRAGGSNLVRRRGAKERTARSNAQTSRQSAQTDGRSNHS